MFTLPEFRVHPSIGRHRPVIMITVVVIMVAVAPVFVMDRTISVMAATIAASSGQRKRRHRPLVAGRATLRC
jgi:hypothetical protein